MESLYWERGRGFISVNSTGPGAVRYTLKYCNEKFRYQEGTQVVWRNGRSPDNKLKTALLISVFITVVSVVVMLIAGYLLTHIRGA